MAQSKSTRARTKLSRSISRHIGSIGTDSSEVRKASLRSSAVSFSKRVRRLEGRLLFMRIIPCHANVWHNRAAADKNRIQAMHRRPFSACHVLAAMDVPPDGAKSAAWNLTLWVGRKDSRENGGCQYILAPLQRGTRNAEWERQCRMQSAKCRMNGERQRIRGEIPPLAALGRDDTP